ncbi:MAG: ABC transporter permease subunit [Clostridiales bacterium]|nr:ABC transporter permease subunit [Clostridiales bacterium]
MSEKLKKISLKVAAIVFWIAVWQIGAYVANKNLMIKIPLPLETIKTFFQNCTDYSFWKTVITSLGHIIFGFVLAVLVGIIGGMLASQSKVFDSFSSPMIHLVRSVPVAAFIIVAWLWIPTKILPSFISFLMVMPIIWSHTEAGLKSIDEKLIEASQIYGISKKDIILRVKLPLIYPQLRTGCITGLGIAWKAGVAAEVISGPTGSLGALLSSAKSSIDYTQVFAVTLMIVVLSVLLENILKLLWKEQKR